MPSRFHQKPPDVLYPKPHLQSPGTQGSRRPDVSLGVLGASQTLQAARRLAMPFSKMANNSWWSVSQKHIESSFNIQGSGIHRKFSVACMHDNHILCFLHCEIFIVRLGTGKQINHSINVWWAMWKFHKLFPSTVGHVGTRPPESHGHLSVTKKFKHSPTPIRRRATPFTNEAMARRSQMTYPKSHDKSAGSPGVLSSLFLLYHPCGGRQTPKTGSPTL